MHVKRVLPIIAICLTGTSALADSIARPRTHTKIVAEGKFVFVMYWKSGDWKKEHQQLFADFPESGLYKNDSSKELLWPIDGFYWDSQLRFAPDGIHAIYTGGWPSHHGAIDAKALKQTALRFFANGKVIREYSIGELIIRPELLKHTMSVSHFQWRTETTIYRTLPRVEVMTQDLQWFVFDYQTGAIVTRIDMKESARLLPMKESARLLPPGAHFESPKIDKWWYLMLPIALFVAALLGLELAAYIHRRNLTKK